MSDGTTNPTESEVNKPQLNMFDVMFGSEEDTNPTASSDEVSESESSFDEQSLIASEQTPVDDGEYSEEEVLEDDGTEDYEVEVEEATQETSPAYTVKIDGEEFEVTLDELRNGYQRQADYTRKSQSLAEQRKAYEANIAAVQKEREQYGQVLEQMANYQNLELAKYNDVNWQELKDTDPMTYMEKRLEFQDAKDRVAQVREEQRRVQEQTTQEFSQRLSETIQAEATKLVEALPEYGDPSSNVKQELRNYALSLGFGEQDIDNITDHRVVLVLHKAMMQDKASQGTVKRKTKTVPKVVKSGTPESKQTRSRKESQAKRERLRQTGTKRDAASVFLELLD